jgi:hypothetical protein
VAFVQFCVRPDVVGIAKAMTYRLRHGMRRDYAHPDGPARIADQLDALIFTRTWR